jgi:small subunit ribosomal protein S14
MTASDLNKILKQLKNKPEVMQKVLKHNRPKKRKIGISTKKCERCGRFGAHINSYGLNLCRHCFREIAEEIDFKKYS